MKRILFVSLAIAIALVVFGVFPASAVLSNPITTGTISGKVVSSYIYVGPIIGETVNMLDSSRNVVDTVTTDIDGKYTFEGVSEGTYMIAANGRFMAAPVRDVTVVAGETIMVADIRVQVEPELGPVPVHLVLLLTGATTALPGDVIDVPVTIANNPGIAGFQIELNFDKTKLTPMSITKGVTYSDSSLTSNVQSDVDLSTLDFVTVVLQSDSDITANGELFSVKFRVAEGLADGTIPISLQLAKLANQNLDNNIVPIRINGGIKVVSFLYGDISGDNVIDIKDLVLLSQYLSKKIELTPEQLISADVHNDSVVDSKDAVKLAQHLAKWQGIVLGK